MLLTSPLQILDFMIVYENFVFWRRETTRLRNQGSPERSGLDPRFGKDSGTILKTHSLTLQ